MSARREPWRRTRSAWTRHRTPTSTTVPSVSDAEAVIAIDAGAVALAPSAGLVTVTDGAAFAGGCCGAACVTLTVTGADDVAPPRLSIARAVSA